MKTLNITFWYCNISCVCSINDFVIRTCLLAQHSICRSIDWAASSLQLFKNWKWLSIILFWQYIEWLLRVWMEIVLFSTSTYFRCKCCIRTCMTTQRQCLVFVQSNFLPDTLHAYAKWLMDVVILLNRWMSSYIRSGTTNSILSLVVMVISGILIRMTEYVSMFLTTSNW